MTEPEKKEQFKPLAPAAFRFTDFVDERDFVSTEFRTRPTQKYCIKLCGCCTAIFLIVAVIILTLKLTLFWVKDPILNMNSIYSRLNSFEGADALNSTTNFSPANNIVVDVSIKNPNVASFKFTNTTTHVYYNGSVIGEGENLEGRIKARRTLRTNITIDVMMDKVLEVPRFRSDSESGMLAITSYTRVIGKVKIINFIKRRVVVEINCRMDVNISSLGIQHWSCRRWVLF